MKVALIQMNSQGDKGANLAAARRLIERAVAEERPDLVALPEVWPCLTEDPEVRNRAAEPLGDGEAYHMLRELAAAHRIHLHGGSLIERDGDRLAALHLRTGSYANWPVLAHAVPGNLVPDFPLINKSFELCYACVDR